MENCSPPAKYKRRTNFFGGKASLPSYQGHSWPPLTSRAMTSNAAHTPGSAWAGSNCGDISTNYFWFTKHSERLHTALSDQPWVTQPFPLLLEEKNWKRRPSLQSFLLHPSLTGTQGSGEPLWIDDRFFFLEWRGNLLRTVSNHFEWPPWQTSRHGTWTLFPLPTLATLKALLRSLFLYYTIVWVLKQEFQIWMFWKQLLCFGTQDLCAAVYIRSPRSQNFLAALHDKIIFHNSHESNKNNGQRRCTDSEHFLFLDFVCTHTYTYVSLYICI